MLADPALRKAVGKVSRRAVIQSLTVGTFDVILTPVKLAVGHVGLVVGRPQGSSSPDPELDLPRLAAALAGALEADGQGRTEYPEEEFDRVSSLFRRLQEAVERGSEVEVVRSFAERVGASVPSWLDPLYAGLEDDPNARELVSASLFFYLVGGKLGPAPVFASISGYAETLIGSNIDAETSKEFLQTIHRNAERIYRLGAHA